MIRTLIQITKERMGIFRTMPTPMVVGFWQQQIVFPRNNNLVVREEESKEGSMRGKITI